MMGAFAVLPTTTQAQSSDPYISAIDDRPAARLRRERERGAVERPRDSVEPSLDLRPPMTRPAEPRASFEPEMIVINPGQFLMGSPSNELQRDRNEGPQIPITFNYAFEIGKYEVTFDEWSACVRDGGCKGYRPNDNGWGRGKRPVTNISYQDAQNYIAWLNKKSGKQYRLPSEAEWEYVARAGQPTPFSTGNGWGVSDREANFNGEFPYGDGAPKGKYLRKTVPVGRYAANAFGVFDIHGNVYEWVSDCYVAGHIGNPGDGRPRRDGNCDRRIIRGGSWVTHGYQMRAAKRLSYTMDYRYDDFGFRLARTVPVSQSAPPNPLDTQMVAPPPPEPQPLRLRR